MGSIRLTRGAGSRLRLSPASRQSSEGVVAGCSRAVLWLAVLLYGGHAGAALYEMLVVTPLWTTGSPQSAQDWSVVVKVAIQPMAYKEPAVIALGSVSLAILWLSSWKVAARGLMVVSGVLGVTLVAVTVLFALPTLERMRDAGVAMTDQDLAREVLAWQMWCKARLGIVLAAWAAALAALVRASSRQPSSVFTSTRP